jgi:hypothetical protein
MEEESGQLQVGVAEPVHERDAVLLEDLAGLRCGLASDQAESLVGVGSRLLDELPGRGGARVLLELHGDPGPVTGEPHEGIGLPTAGHWLLDHGQAGDLAKDAEGLGLEGRPFNFYFFSLIHSDCEYRTAREAWAASALPSSSSARASQPARGYREFIRIFRILRS